MTPSTIWASSAPELLLDLGEGDVGVLDGVVQQRACNGDIVESLTGDDLGDRDRVADVGLARLAHLALVGPGGQFERPLDHLDLEPWDGGRCSLEQIAQLGRRRTRG